MTRYDFKFTASVVIHAENVAQASQLAKKLRLTSAPAAGYKRPRNNRDGVQYMVMVHSERAALTRKP